MRKLASLIAIAVVFASSCDSLTDPTDEPGENDIRGMYVLDAVNGDALPYPPPPIGPCQNSPVELLTFTNGTLSIATESFDMRMERCRLGCATASWVCAEVLEAVSIAGSYTFDGDSLHFITDQDPAWVFRSGISRGDTLRIQTELATLPLTLRFLRERK